MNHARASHTALTILAATALAACSDVGDYIPPEDDMAQDMSAADMTSPPKDMKNTAPADMPDDPVDMSVREDLSSPDMPTISNAPRLSATSSAEGVELSWSALDGALGYEIKIDDGEWIDAGQATTYTDTEAPSGAIISATIDASDATRREAVDLSIGDIQLEEAPEREYRVRAIFNTGEGDESAPKSARRTTEVKAYQWQYTDDDTLWMDLTDATMDTAEDPTARASGASRRYRVLIDTGDGNAPTPSQPDEGFRLAAIQVTTGGGFSCALLNNGNAKCWGENGEGQLGQGDTTPRGNQPGDMPPPNINLGGKPKSIVAGNRRVCAHMENDTVRCWGDLYEGTASSFIGDEPGEMPPPDIDLGGPIRSLPTGGAFHQCAIMQSGAVRCWGLNHRGQLGLGDIEPRGADMGTLPPPNVPLGGGIKKLQSQINSTCVITDNDEFMCWGGVGTFTASLTDTLVGDESGEMPPPVLPAVPNGYRAIDISQSPTGASICVKAEHINTGDIFVYCWGLNDSGQLGAGDTENLGDDPNELPGNRVSGGGRIIDKVYTSVSLTCALMTTRQVYCWGSNFGVRPVLGPDFILPHGDESSELNGKLLDLGGTVQDLSFNVSHGCALMGDGQVKCWGYGDSGRLGNESNSDIGSDNSSWPPPNVKLW